MIPVSPSLPSMLGKVEANIVSLRIYKTAFLLSMCKPFESITFLFLAKNKQTKHNSFRIIQYYLRVGVIFICIALTVFNNEKSEQTAV